MTTRAEVLAALSVAIDLGLGQPAEHMLRSALIATRIADRLGLSPSQRDCAYYSTLIMWIGCHADSHEYARWFGDDIAVRRASYLVDWSGLPYQRFLLTNVRHGGPLLQRLRTATALYADARGHISRLIHSQCTSAAMLAGRIGLDADVQRVLGYAVAMARRRRGGQFDPVVVDAFVADPESILAVPMTGDVWTTALQQAPDRHTRLDTAGLDALLIALGDFVDLKCPFTAGHSRAVAALAADAATAAGLDPDAVALTRRAGHVHDIGRIGVSNQLWSKESALSMAEFERVRLHPYLTERILRQVPGLAPVAAVAMNHHERLDGTGYPRGLGARELTMPDRLLAAAVAYRSAVEPRPYRAPMTDGDATRRLTQRVRDGGLDPVAAEAVLHAAGGTAPRRSRPAGLTAREAEGAVPGRAGRVQQGDRAEAGDQREDRPQPRRAHLRQDRGVQPRRGEPVRPRARPARPAVIRPLGRVRRRNVRCARGVRCATHAGVPARSDRHPRSPRRR